MANQNPLADTAYNYIEHYKELVKDATRRLETAGQSLATATDTLADDEVRFAYLEDLLKRLQQTDKTYAQASAIIARAIRLSTIIVENVHFVAEAIELLMCSVRRMSRSADNLKGRIDDVKKQLNNLDKNNGLYKKLLEFEDKNNDAINANKEAIKKSLDTLKEIYILHVNLAGRTQNIMKKIGDYSGHIIFYGEQGITESCGRVEIFEHCSDEMQGLISHFVWLQKLLNENSAYPTADMNEAERKAIPCEVDEKAKTTFPLDKGANNGFFAEISSEKTKAETSRTKSKSAFQSALSNRDGVQAELVGYQAALKAAEEARKVTAA